MCLACELDALWYAESERLATEGGRDTERTGVLPAAERPGGTESGEAKQAGETPADPASVGPGSRFFCEEAE